MLITYVCNVIKYHYLSMKADLTVHSMSRESNVRASKLRSKADRMGWKPISSRSKRCVMFSMGEGNIVDRKKYVVGRERPCRIVP